MCDYSLCGLPTRLASEGEELVVHKFRSGSLGLVSSADLRQPENPRPLPKGLSARISSWFTLDDVSTSPTVVCVPPGARLILKGVPADLQERWNVRKDESAIFTQMGASANTYRDAVRFWDGTEVLLQHLREGMRVYVLSLGGAAPETEHHLATQIH